MGDDVLLSAQRLTKHYSLPAEVVTALEDVTLDIRPGDFVAVLGPSGSGKTTLLNLLGGLDRPTEGQLWWRGRSYSELTEPQLAALRLAEMGMVFQDACLMAGLSALDNTRLPQVLAGQTHQADRARGLLERFDLGSKLHRFPRQLSRGEKQRVAVARALANGPALLLADEPTGNLDRAATKRAFAIFKELNQQDHLTIVLATHDEAVLDFAGRRVVLSDGRVADEGDL